jgi:hypothetical protein
MKKPVTTHDAHDTDDRLTACGRRWTALPAEAADGPVSCKSCIRNLRSLWKNRGG